MRYFHTVGVFERIMILSAHKNKINIARGREILTWSLTILKLSDCLLDCVNSIDELGKGILHFCYRFEKLFVVFPVYSFFRVFICPLTFLVQ